MTSGEATAVLIETLCASDEYQAYITARDIAMQNDTTRAVYAEYKRLQTQLQADAVNGRQDADANKRFYQLAQTLQYNQEAATFLYAEYRIHSLLGDIYKRLAKAMEIDLSMLEP